MFFEKNCQALAQNPDNQSIIDQLLQTTTETNIALVETEAGDYSLIYKNIAIHALSGADAEAKAVCDEHCRPNNKALHLIFGLGLGYHLVQAFEKSPGRIRIYEPNLPLLRFILENVDLSEYLANPRVCLCLSPKELLSKLEWEYNLGDSVDIIVLNGHLQLMGEHLPALIRDEVFKVVKIKQDSASTVFAYHRFWNKQFYRDLPYLAETMPFSPLANRFAGKPALIISAGPSLDKSYEWIRSVQDSMVLIAVGSALRALMLQDIIPDFGVFIEFAGCKQQLHGLGDRTQAVSFLLGPFTEDVCYTQPAKHRFQLNLTNYSELCLWQEKMLGENQPTFASGGSVSQMALKAGVAMGCDRIILVGQDLCFKDNQFYAGGVEARFEDGCVVMDEADENLAKRILMTEVKGWQGESLKTGVDYAFYITELEEYARRNQRAENPVALYNASVGGAFINGYIHKPLNELISELALAPFDKNLDDLSLSAETIASRQEHINQEAQRLVDAMASCCELAKTAYHNLNCILKGSIMMETSYSKRYQHAHDEFNKRLTKNELLLYALQCQLIELYRNTDTTTDTDEALMNILRQQLPYYKNISETLDDLLTVLKPVNEILKVNQAQRTAKAL